MKIVIIHGFGHYEFYGSEGTTINYLQSATINTSLLLTAISVKSHSSGVAC